MGEHEDIVRAAIARKYGSIPRMASETGIAKNTIYHALERGLDNTTTDFRQYPTYVPGVHRCPSAPETRTLYMRDLSQIVPGLNAPFPHQLGTSELESYLSGFGHKKRAPTRR
jgi:hypothetical protein